MAFNTKIEWTDATWSPIRARVRQDAADIAGAKGYRSLVEIASRMAGRVGQHCEHVSPGCEHSYAETNNHRCLPGNGTGLPYDQRSRDLVEVFVDERVLLQPLKWRQIKEQTAAEEVVGSYHLRPRRIFVENQSDLFAEWVTDEMRDRVCAVGIVSGHILQFLTKRPAEMLRYFSDPETSNRIQNQVDELTDDYAYQWPYPNFWPGVSVENQAAADERIPLLLQTPAAVRFVSCEPLLGPVDLSCIPWPTGFPFSIDGPGSDGFDALRFDDRNSLAKLPHLDWVIAGGESGPGARPMHPEWALSLRDQCAAAGVPFFFKQWGEWLPWNTISEIEHLHPSTSICLVKAGGRVIRPFCYEDRPGQKMVRVGREDAGALLDGCTHKAFPEVRA